MIVKTLTLALENKQPVRIIYDSGKSLTERTVDVLSIEDNRVVAYCRLRKNRRVFIVDKILSVCLQADFYEP